MGAQVHAHNVAAAIIERQRAAGRKIDKLQLQKLLYLVQGVQIARTGQPAFKSCFEAWARGPVVREIERTYSENDGMELDRPFGGDSAKLDETLSASVDLVLDLFGTWLGAKLERHTKTEDSPWCAARAAAGVSDGEPSSAEIPLAEIRRWFLTHPIRPDGVRTRPDGADPREVEADDDIAAGRIIRHDDDDNFLTLIAQ